MIAPDFNKWLAIGTGVGIEIGRQDLIVTVVRARPSGAKILGELIVPRFREQAGRSVYPVLEEARVRPFGGYRALGTR